MTDELTEFLAAYPPAVQETAIELRRMIRGTLPDALEIVDRKDRVIGYGFGSGYNDMICTIILSKTGVKLGMVRGTELPDPRGLLEGTGKVHRHVAFARAAEVRKPGVKPLLRAALTAWKRRQGERRKPGSRTRAR